MIPLMNKIALFKCKVIVEFYGALLSAIINRPAKRVYGQLKMLVSCLKKKG